MFVTNALQSHRLNYLAKIPSVLHELQAITLSRHKLEKKDPFEICEIFPNICNGQLLSLDQATKACATKALKIGVVLSGGPAAGGHNVIAGLWDALQSIHKDSQLIGFKGGLGGVINNQAMTLNAQIINSFRNQGGFDLLGTGRTKIDSLAQTESAAQTLVQNDLDGLVIIGGDDSNTNAAYLAEFCAQRKLAKTIVGVPKTIDGDLKNEYLDISFGFDTACKVYAETIGNIARDALSQKKYYFFVKMMGRTASHVTLECALKTQINLALIGEEVSHLKLSLMDITNTICDLICQRAELSKNYGVILIPEGLLEFIPECLVMIKEINKLLSSGQKDIEQLKGELGAESAHCYNSLPLDIQRQLLLDRDPHGNIQVSKIETERLLVDLVTSELERRSKKGAYCGQFNAQTYFCGYEGRAALPSNFDCNYCTTLGYIAALLIRDKANGYMCSIKNLKQDVEQWQLLGIPLTSLFHVEMRNNKTKAVISKALVDLRGPLFKHFTLQSKRWKLEDSYCYPGPMQFAGPQELVDQPPLSLLYI